MQDAPVAEAGPEQVASADEAAEDEVASPLEYIPAIVVPAEEAERNANIDASVDSNAVERPRSFAEAFPPVLRGRRARWIFGVAALALLGAGAAGFAMGRGASAPQSESVVTLQQSSRGVIEEPQAGSLQPTSQVEAEAPAPVPHFARRSTPFIPDWDRSTPTATRTPRIPSRSQARRMTRTMERLGNKVMAGVDVKIDSISRAVELPPPTFDKP